ncbi:hypothetical protein F7U66_01930 [Vibrio parahaemolyticus]|nr:hypothetical protein [Vibrio parahaemolyticus]
MTIVDVNNVIPEFAYAELSGNFSERVSVMDKGNALSNVFSKIAMSDESFRPGCAIHLRIETGEEIVVEIDRHYLLREHRPAVGKDVVFELKTYGDVLLLTYRLKSFHSSMPIQVVDREELLELVDSIRGTDKVLEAKPAWHFSIKSSFKPLSFDSVFVKASDKPELYISHKYTPLALNLTDEVSKLVQSKVMDNIRYKLTLADMGEGIYRLDFSHTDIIGGQTICYVDCSTTDIESFYR